MPRRRSGHADQQRQTSCSYRMQCVREKLFSKRVEPVYCTADMCVTTNIHMSIHYRPSSACSMLQSRSPLSPEQTFLGLSCCVCLHLIPRMPAVWKSKECALTSTIPKELCIKTRSRVSSPCKDCHERPHTIRGKALLFTYTSEVFSFRAPRHCIRKADAHWSDIPTMRG